MGIERLTSAMRSRGTAAWPAASFSTKPGATQFTVAPEGARSTASARAKASMLALAAAEGVRHERGHADQAASGAGLDQPRLGGRGELEERRGHGGEACIPRGAI